MLRRRSAASRGSPFRARFVHCVSGKQRSADFLQLEKCLWEEEPFVLVPALPGPSLPSVIPESAAHLAATQPRSRSSCR